MTYLENGISSKKVIWQVV